MSHYAVMRELRRLTLYCYLGLACEIAGLVAVPFSIYAAYSGNVALSAGLMLCAYTLTLWCDRKLKEVKRRITDVCKLLDEHEHD